MADELRVFGGASLLGALRARGEKAAISAAVLGRGGGVAAGCDRRGEG